MDHPQRPDRSGPRPPPVGEYYYRPRLALRGGNPPVPAADFIERVSGQTGRLTLRFTCLTPVHIGTGMTGLEGGRAILLTARSDEIPVIPGTVVKGAFRTIGEVLARSCPDQRCKACLPCLIFGAVGYRARVTFGPAVPEVIPAPRPLGFLLPPRSSRGPLRDDGKIRLYNHRRAYPDPKGVELVEVLPIGSKLLMDITYQGLKPNALGFLLLVTGAVSEHGFFHKLGAGKSQGLGSIQVEITSHRVRKCNKGYPVFPEVEPERSDMDLVRAYLESESACDSSGMLAETLSVLRERSQRLEVPLP